MTGRTLADVIPQISKLFFPGCSRASGHPTSRTTARKEPPSWVHVTVNKPANDNQPSKTTAAIPLAIRLFRQKRSDDLARLVRYGAVVTVPSWLSAEGGMPEAGKPLADRVTEIRPSPDEMVTLAALDAIAAHEGYSLSSRRFSPSAHPELVRQRISTRAERNRTPRRKKRSSCVVENHGLRR